MKILLFIFLFVFFGCSSKNGIPKEIIQPPRMKFIVWDMMMAGEFATNQFSKDSLQLNLKTTETFQKVFAIHKITKEQFYTSFQYYQSHPQQNKILFDSVNNYASRVRDTRYRQSQ